GSAALSLAFYNKKPEELSPDEKTVIVNLVAALRAAVGSMAAGNSTGIGSGANAARVEVENNYLTAKQTMSWLEKYRDATTDEQRKKLIDLASQIDASQQEKALSTQITKDYLVKQQDDLIRLLQSTQCDVDCRKMAQYSINQLSPIIDNYGQLQAHNNIPKALVASVSLSIPLLSRAIAPTISEWVGSQQLAKRLGGAGIGGTANTMSQLQTIINNPKEKFSISSLFIATVSAGLSTAMKMPGTVMVSSAGAGISSVIDGKKPLPPIVGAASGALVGYYTAAGFEKVGNRYINPLRNGFKDMPNGKLPFIINPPVTSSLPSTTGAATGSYLSERFGKRMEDITAGEINEKK
ncbi:VENN motif pre-toxin domain-containing protein, partial [Cronobacter condimenti]